MQGLTTTTILRLLAASGLVALFLMAGHSSTEATVLGRWSSRYAFLLAFVTIATFLTALLINTSLRARIFRQNAVPLSKRQGWAMMAAGLAILPVLHHVLHTWLASNEDRVIILFVSLSLTSIAAVMLYLFYRTGIANRSVTLPDARLVLLLLAVVYLLLAAQYIGQVPVVHFADETRRVGNGLRLFSSPQKFVMLDASRTADTWLYIPGLTPVYGAYMRVFGEGLLQLRFFSLLLAWLSIPFLYLIARRLYGRSAALISAVFSIALPLHLVSARSDVWVATATAMALWFHLCAHDPKASRPRLPGFLCGFIVFSAIDGHPYGAFFALLFTALNLFLFLSGLRSASGRHSSKVFSAFMAGAVTYALVWSGYHLVLPGVQLTAIPGLISKTWAFEANIGSAELGSGFRLAYLVKFVQSVLYLQPYILVLFVPALLSGLRRRKTTDGPLLIIAAGSFAFVILTWAHFNHHYVLFWLPFLCLWSGAWLSAFPGSCARLSASHNPQISFGALYLLLAFLLLSALHLDDSARANRLINEERELLINTGREIDRMLPAEDIVVAGTLELYLGMPQRLNFAGTCSFAWGKPEYWPLTAPQAIIHTPGLDRGCDRLPGWLIDHDFQPARCFPLPGVGDGVAILYLLPELMPEEIAIDCAPEDLDWPQRAA